MKKYIIGFLFLSCAICVVSANRMFKDNLFEENVEALTSNEGESLNCIPDANSVCVDKDYGVVQPGYYYCQH